MLSHRHDLVRLVFGPEREGFSAADLRISKTAWRELLRQRHAKPRNAVLRKANGWRFCCTAFLRRFAPRVLTQRITLKRDPHCVGRSPSYLLDIKADRAPPSPDTRRPAK
jgi:hypothetical protein